VQENNFQEVLDDSFPVWIMGSMDGAVPHPEAIKEVSKMSKKFKDYALILKDSTSKTYELCINGDCINEQILAGVSEEEAVEMVESNAFYNAIDSGDIGADAWVDGRAAA